MDPATNFTEAPDSGGLFVSVDYLNWRARGDLWSLDPAAYSSAAPDDAALSSNNNSGIRAEIGYRFASQWDVGWRFTHFDSLGVYNGPGAFQPQNPIAGGLEARGAFRYNVHDLEIGRTIEMTDSVDLRLFGGFRWATLGLNRSAIAYDPLPPPSSFPIVRDLGNTIETIDAYGMGLGAEARWNVGHAGFYLFGRGEMFGLVGVGTRQIAPDPSEIPVEPQGPFHLTQALIAAEAAVGLGWRRGHWDFCGGYEINVWPSVFTPAGQSSSWPESREDMVLDGWFLRATFSR
jgi:hypothetical protein